MKCPFCGGLLGARNTYTEDPFIIKRRRVCKGCGSVIYTLEVFEEGFKYGVAKEKETVEQNGEAEERTREA